MAKVFTYRNWTQQELEFLEDNNGILSTQEIAVHLNRTMSSIEEQRSQLHIGRYDNFYTFNSLGPEIGLSRETVRKYSKKGLLPKRKTPSASGNRKPAMIFEKDIYKFIKKYWYKLTESKIINPEFKSLYLKYKLKGEVK